MVEFVVLWLRDATMYVMKLNRKTSTVQCIVCGKRQKMPAVDLMQLINLSKDSQISLLTDCFRHRAVSQVCVWLH
jgi:hypothetical protein